MNYQQTKSPFASATIWGGVTAIGAAGVGLLGYSVSPEDAVALPVLLSSVASGVGGIVAILGRIKASKRIG